jgi:hypothetical protein
MEALTGSKRTATILTWLVLVLFCCLISTGWWYLLAPTIGQQIVAGLVAAALTAVAAICARQIGQYRADAILKGNKPVWYHGWKPYVFLAIISALGTLNAAFVLFESRAILRHDVATVRNAYNVLRDSAHAHLPPRGFAEKSAQLEGQLKRLHEEITDDSRPGNYCGVGQGARAIATEIQRIIPGFDFIRGAGPIKPCNAAKGEAMYEAHAKIARELLQSDPAYLATNGPDKLAFLRELDSRHGKMDRELAALETAASGIGTTDHLNKGALYSARDDYNADRSTFFTLNGAPVQGIDEIRSLQSDQVNSYAQTLELFWKRLFNGSTWFYLLLALAIDFVAIYLITQLNVRFGHRGEPASDYDEENKRFYTDPRFLWTNVTPS